ncbi:LuxR family transcriptional regulator [Actinoplanes sp. N902-109]|uniref:helix-turn-helix transcriptional regulator n=1 Tax=Actinoplanes sp. (strain N902-109) TaxID=649831 RepID=UPI0003295E67|nr:LuxR family transcriptional regulator [Actinoplanes sp. N902-109]AGL16503.1 LuxR family transcriptional regulator [Actinoplanes sp. N902-109]
MKVCPGRALTDDWKPRPEGRWRTSGYTLSSSSPTLGTAHGAGVQTCGRPDPAGAPEHPVGRRPEWQTIRRFLDEPGHPGRVPLLLAGEPGAGKTALLTAAARHATGSGFLVLPVEGAEFETAIAGSSLHQLFLQARSRAGDGIAELTGTVDAGLDLIAAEPPPVGRLAEVTARLLTGLALSRPVLVTVDDSHWLDPVSVQVLVRVVGSHLTGSARVGFLATSRLPDDVLAGRTNARVLTVGPLSGTAAEALLAERFPDLDRDRRRVVLRAARGNPLALLELARSGSQADTFDAASLPLSYPLLEAFGSRPETLDPPTRRLALMAALDAGDLPSTALVHRDGTAGSGFRFRHPLVARVLLQEADQADVREAHRVLGLRYAQDPDDAGLAAWHLARASAAPDDKVAGLLEQASVVVLARGDGPAAVDTLLLAASLSERVADRTRRISQAALITCSVSGDLAAAEEMLAAAQASDPGFHTSLSAVTASAATLLGHGDIDAAHRSLTSAVERYPHRDRADDRVLIDALLTLHTICWYAGRAELWAPYRRAVERLDPAIPPVLRVCTYTEPDPARITPTVHAELTDLLPTLAGARGPLGVIGIALAAAHFDELAACRPALTRLAGAARRGGALVPAIHAMYLMAADDMTTGHWARCRALLTEGIDLAERHDCATLAFSGRRQLALLAAAEGNEEELADLVARLEHWALPRGLQAITMYTQYASALAASGRGDFRSAYRHAELLSPPGTFAPFVTIAPTAAFELIEAAMRTGQHEAAQAHAEAIEKSGMATWSSRWGLIAASCLALAEDDTPAIEHLRALLAGDEAARWPFDRARGQFVVGAHLRRHNQVAESRAHLAAAARTFAELGAAGWAARAEVELAATAAVRRRVDASGSQALSARERATADLAATGLSTKEIAERLGVSPRTVSNHLYRAFAKLGVTSRAGLRKVLDG